MSQLWRFFSGVGKPRRRNPLTRGSQPQKARGNNKQTRLGGKRGPKRARGRPRGSQNFFTRDMKTAIIDACNELGFDGRGQEGMKGYMKFLGKNFPPVFAALIRAAMPAQVTVERVERHKPYESYEEVQEALERIGIKLKEPPMQLQYYKGPLIELDADDVTDGDSS